MSFSYSGNPSSSVVDQVRFYLQDTVDTGHLVEDAEILFMDDQMSPIFNSTLATAAHIAEIISNRFATELNISGDGVSISASELQTKYKSIAEVLWSQFRSTRFGGPDGGGYDFYPSYDPTVAPLSFGIGFTDNQGAGRQNYGTQGQLWSEDELRWG